MTRILHISSGQILRFPPETGRDLSALFNWQVTEEYENTHLWKKYRYTTEELITFLSHGGLTGILAFNGIYYKEGNPSIEEFEVLL